MGNESQMPKRQASAGTQAAPSAKATGAEIGKHKVPVDQESKIREFLNASESYSVDDILADIGEFYSADRAYVFRIDEEAGIAINTHEWCAAGVVPQIDNLKALPLEQVGDFLNTVREGEYVINDVEAELEPDDPVYKVLEPQDVHSLIMAPLVIDGEFAGAIGVDNPREYTEMSLLQSVVSTILSVKLEANFHEREQDESYLVLDKVRSQFVTMYYADFTTDYMHTYKTNDDYGPKYGVTQHYSVSMGAYVENDVAEKDRERMRAATDSDNVMERFETEDAFELEFEDHSFGDVRYCKLRYIKANDEGTCAVICGSDVTVEVREKKEREAAFAEQAAIVGALSMSFRNVFVANLRDGSARAIRLADGYNVKSIRDVENTTFPFDAVVDRWVRETVHPDDKERVKQTLSIENLRKIMSEQEKCVGTYRNIEDGVVHHYQYDFRRVGNTENLVAGFQLIDTIVEEQAARDKKERELMEMHLRDVREHSEVVDSLSTIYSTIFRADVDTREYEILTTIPSMRELAPETGNFDDVIAPIIASFVVPEHQAMMDEFLDFGTLAVRLQWINTISTDYKAPSGQWIQARFIAKRRDEIGSVKEILYVARDITEEKTRDLEQQEQLSQALAAAQQANKAKSTFLNNMSHDIRTPMNAIIGFTALAQTHIDDAAQVQDYLGKISTSSTHLLSLINDILDMSRIESGTVKLDEKAVHIPDLLHDLRTMIQGLVNSKNLNLFIDTQDVVHEDVVTDKLRLNQVLINIVGNAVKFTQSGGDIIIRLVEKPCSVKGHTTFEFSVKDNGIGMSSEFLEHIFDTFSREHSSTVSGIQGTGLGMAITKNIVDMMGGEIRVESEEGKGSLFTVALDLRLADDPVKHEPIPELLGARALVVDDDLNTCRSVSKMLRDIQMRPDWTSSGKEAIVHAQDAAESGDEYKVYIIDYLMPDMNGIETVRRIRKVISDDVPIIVLTAYDWEDLEAEAREAGVTAFVSKPIFMSELRAVLTQPVAGAEADAGAEDAGQAYDYSGKRVLLVEDNDLNCEIATVILQETGMTVDGVSDGDDAVAAINDAPAGTYDLVLMDIQMPRMDGYTATREIRTLPDNAKANVPIVAMTANAFEEDRRKAYESGMNGHIIKPISIEEIAKVIDKVFADGEGK
jgi:signal transduction histidine kinase/DNA-binding response OmpR family regulator